MKALIVLTPSESKRLIGKAVAQLEVVQQALKNGTVIIDNSSTNAFVAEEILKMNINKNLFASGVIFPKGLCVNRARAYQHIVLNKGKIVGDITKEKYSLDGIKKEDSHIHETINTLQKGDVWIKSANALDAGGGAGILMASVTGGRVGMALGVLMARGVDFIIPVGLEKLIPVPVSEVAKELGQGRLDYCMGLKVGLMPVYGQVVSEIEAIKILTGTTAIPASAGGISGAEGAITLLLKGEPAQIKSATTIIEDLKGEPAIFVPLTDCGKCPFIYCQQNITKK